MDNEKAIAILKNGVNAKNYDEQIEARQIAIIAIQSMSEEPVDTEYLEDWYINSIDNTIEPVWTTEHLEELTNDFILIPKGDNIKNDID